MLHREATYFTPDLILKDNRLFISGKLWMENPPKYFEKLFSVTKSEIHGDFEVLIEVDHLNSSSIKQMVLYFKFLRDLKKAGQIQSLKIEWRINEDDQEHIGLVNDLSWITDIEIQITKLSINSEK